MAGYSYNAMFVKEFQELQRVKRSENTLDIHKFPIPEKFIDVTEDKLVQIETFEEYYKKLNGDKVIMLTRPNLVQRLFNNKGEFELDEEGNVRMKSYTVPTGSVAILSKKSINVPIKFELEGYGYVDYIDLEDGGKMYIYVIPKENCYQCNQLALVLSANKMSKYYRCMWVNLLNGHRVYLSIIRYTGNITKNRVLKTSTDYGYLVKSMKQLVQSWYPKVGKDNMGMPSFAGGLMYHPNYMQLAESIQQESETINNLACGEFTNVMDINDFVGVEQRPLSHTRNELEEQETY